jgi:hypothetical protein
MPYYYIGIGFCLGVVACEYLSKDTVFGVMLGGLLILLINFLKGSK